MNLKKVEKSVAHAGRALAWSSGITKNGDNNEYA